MHRGQLRKRDRRFRFSIHLSDRLSLVFESEDAGEYTGRDYLHVTQRGRRGRPVCLAGNVIHVPKDTDLVFSRPSHISSSQKTVPVPQLSPVSATNSRPCVEHLSVVKPAACQLQSASMRTTALPGKHARLEPAAILKKS